MRGVPETIVSNIRRGSFALSAALASVAAWMTWVKRPGGGANSDTSPATNAKRLARCGARAAKPAGSRLRIRTRSEEHTSELQSLMRNSNAVFCLKKKNTKTQPQKHHRKP